ncbi:ChbG/HpnK family deacetylase [Rhodoferax sp.]|uniref:ChbG/HpnK family deacetylase n=1 Tax=Rhodoferax sp. TaxID=50421 RepID=UPI002623C9FB|nr:ChbG/HpnK family deacetylase [Rhodoferax sp.]MDD2925766.1 ChbG/HpnK family deacetylase [Rhodoferax sp.]
MKNIIICADDFAVNQSASLGIIHLARLGRISATSAMVLSPRWPQDAALLQPLRGQIDVGLHLDWTSDFAITAGHGVSLGAAMRHAVLGGLDPVQARRVVARQLDLFEAHWHAAPDYVDGHQHVQQFAGIRQALVDELTQRYGRQAPKPYLRISRAPAGLADLKSRVIAWMGANALENIAVHAGFVRARGLFGVYNFGVDPARYATLMRRWLARGPEGAILMCHPAQAAEPGDEIGLARAQEFAYLASPAFAAALAAAQVQVARGGACLSALTG